MTTEDDIYIPSYRTALKHIKPISTTNLVGPHDVSYDVSISRCKTECPCRIWSQCSYYNKNKRKKSRGDEDEYMKVIWEYYNNVFRITYDMHIVNMNG